MQGAGVPLEIVKSSTMRAESCLWEAKFCPTALSESAMLNHLYLFKTIEQHQGLHSLL
jgi:hypothetical protein